MKELVCLSALMCAALGFAQEQPSQPSQEGRYPGRLQITPPARENVPPVLPRMMGNFPPPLEERGLVLHFAASTLDAAGNKTPLNSGSKVTLPGRPVSIKLEGDTIVCVVQFTPHIRHPGEIILVAQGQVWRELPGGGIRYETIVRSIPIQFGEQVYFFPLGREKKDGVRLEIEVKMSPYSPNPNFERHPRRPLPSTEPDAE